MIIASSSEANPTNKNDSYETVVDIIPAPTPAPTPSSSATSTPTTSLVSPNKNEIRIPSNYDYSKSTSENYKWKGNGNPPFVGKYASLRQRMDYNYHSYYSAERQYIQDALIDVSYHSIIRDSITAVECEKLEENWLVFTAGTMVSKSSKHYIIMMMMIHP